MSLDALAIGAHPDDVELGCAGTLARLEQSGHSVGILHLSAGEAGTRGDAETRRAEARAAASILGAELHVLDCGDGELRTGRDEEDSLIQKLRETRPRLVLAPAPEDRHPDHGRAFRLVCDACFYSGLAKRSPDLGPSHRPSAMFSYMQHDVSFVPSFVVDVSSTWDRKMSALDAYASQLHPSGREGVRSGADKDSAIKTSSPEFRSAIEGRARHYGQLIGARFGEPFSSRDALAIRDLWTLVP